MVLSGHMKGGVVKLVRQCLRYSAKSRNGNAVPRPVESEGSAFDRLVKSRYKLAPVVEDVTRLVWLVEAMRCCGVAKC